MFDGGSRVTRYVTYKSTTGEDVAHLAASAVEEELDGSTSNIRSVQPIGAVVVERAVGDVGDHPLRTSYLYHHRATVVMSEVTVEGRIVDIQAGPVGATASIHDIDRATVKGILYVYPFPVCLVLLKKTFVYRQVSVEIMHSHRPSSATERAGKETFVLILPKDSVVDRQITQKVFRRDSAAFVTGPGSHIVFYGGVFDGYLRVAGHPDGCSTVDCCIIINPGIRNNCGSICGSVDIYRTTRRIVKLHLFQHQRAIGCPLVYQTTPYSVTIHLKILNC